MFRKNNDHSGGLSGALYLSSFGQMMLDAGVNITFLENSGRSVYQQLVVRVAISNNNGQAKYNVIM